MILLCLIGVVNVSAEYGYFINKKEIETAILEQVKEAETKEQEEQKKQEEQIQQEQAQTIQVQRTQSAYNAPQLTGNNIIIPGVLSNNLATDDGSNFYLNHDINGNYNGVGVPYKDFRTNFNTRSKSRTF